MVSSQTRRHACEPSASLFDLCRGVLECTTTTVATARRENRWYFTKAAVTAFDASSVDGSSAHRAPRSPGGLELGGRPQAAQAREARHKGHDQNDADDDHFPGLCPLLALFVARVGGPGDGVGALDEARENRTKRVGRAELSQRLRVFDGREIGLVDASLARLPRRQRHEERGEAREEPPRARSARSRPHPPRWTVTRSRFSFSRQREEGAPFPFAPSFFRERIALAGERVMTRSRAPLGPFSRSPSGAGATCVGRSLLFSHSALDPPTLAPENLEPELVLGRGERRSEGRGVDT